MMLSKINFRGIEGYVKEGRLKEERRTDLFYYDLTFSNCPIYLVTI